MTRVDLALYVVLAVPLALIAYAIGPERIAGLAPTILHRTIPGLEACAAFTIAGAVLLLVGSLAYGESDRR